MKPPPFLVGAALLFWGWQIGYPLAGALAAVILEGSRVFKARWDLSEQDFSRIWTFCALLLLAALAYAFTANEGPSDLRNFFQNPSIFTSRNAGNASSKTVAAVLRWLPAYFFLFVAAQNYSAAEGVPLETISRIMRLRLKRASKPGRPLPVGKRVDVSYPYFALCLLAASIHPGENSSFFWGLCALLAWVIWLQRSRRFGWAVWAASLAAAVALGYAGQRGVGQLQRYLENLNPQWLANFARHRFDSTQSRTALGQVGQMKSSGKIVIRLQTKGNPPLLLREASYQRYSNQVWYSDVTENDFESVPSVSPLTNDTTYVLLPGKTNSESASIACYLEGGKALLPLPAGAGRLENLAANFLHKSRLGVVLAEGPGLVVFDAFYGPGATIDSPANTNWDLAIPPREAPALEQIAATLRLQEQNPAGCLRTVGAFFRQFSYSTWQKAGRMGGANATPLSRFLLTTRKGHCEYFATATVLLLRQAGIPARYAVGYAVVEGSGGKYVVRQRHAHAWCLVWDEKTSTWQDFDTTPASWVEAETPVKSLLERARDFWSWVWFQFSKFRWGQTHLRQYILWALVPILALLLYQIIFRSRARRRRGPQTQSTIVEVWPGLDSEFYEFERRLAERGVPRPPGEPVSAWLRQAVTEPALAGLKHELEELVRLHYRYRFDPHGLTRFERDELRARTRQCLRLLERAEAQERS
jgi:hypothetical protein